MDLLASSHTLAPKTGVDARLPKVSAVVSAITNKGNASLYPIHFLMEIHWNHNNMQQKYFPYKSINISLYFFGVYIYTREGENTRESSQCDQKFSDAQIEFKPSPFDRTGTN